RRSTRIGSQEQSLSKQPSAEFRARVADAMTHFQAGRLAEAESAYRAALTIVPAVPAVTNNLGVVIAARGRHRAALGCFEEALRADPGFVSAHYNSATSLMRLGQTQEAIKAFGRAAMLEPQHYEAHRALGFLWLSQGERGRALDHLARTHELRRGDDRTIIALKSLTAATRHKLKHDADQFVYLSQRTKDWPRFEQLARNYRAIAEQISNEVVTLSDAQLEALGADYNTAIHLRAAPEVAGRAVNERADRAALIVQFEDQGAISVDDLLTPQALALLRRFLLE